MKRKIQVVATFILLFTTNTFGQFWLSNGSLNNGNPGNNLGTFTQHPINIYTGGVPRAQFTTGGALSSFSGNNGDGLRIRNQGLFPTEGNLDLFTSNNNGQNETHIVFGANGQISGQSNRFEFLAKTNQGFWFNLLNNNQYYKFASNNIVHAFVGNNRFWRIGDQQDANNISANRRLEVVENNWQFRLSRTNGNFTDFQTNANGNLQVLPQNGRVGVNLTSNPTANLDVNGNARIRNVQAAAPNSLLVGVDANGASDVHVRRLDYPFIKS